ncbi:TetR/AcrR family transcriptional regulator [Mycolicibacterium thermoresistibile]
MAADAEAAGRRKSDRTRQAVLDAARVAFARKGFSGVTIRDITDLAGVTRANFYYYFRDKTALFIELGTTTYREAMRVIETLGDGDDARSRDAVAEWVERYFDYLDRNGAFVIRSEHDMPADPDFRAAVARSHRRAATALGQRVAKIAATPVQADAAATGIAVMALLERSWAMVQQDSVSAVPRPVVREAVTELMWRMVQ